MATINIGPGGVAISAADSCSSNDLLASQGNPLGALIESVEVQQITGIKRMMYPSLAESIDRHMPMRPSSATRINGVTEYHTAVGYDGLLNLGGLIDITPGSGDYTNTVSLLNSDGTRRNKGITSDANTNAEACNPAIDGAVPNLGREGYGRRAYTRRLPIPPICFGDWTHGKEEFYAHFTAIHDSVKNGLMAQFAADQYRWQISKARFNAAPIQVAQGSGKAKLPVSGDLYTAANFGRMPQHWGSADWMAGMLRESEIDPRENLRVELPASIFVKYKEQLASIVGVNFYEGAGNITRALNAFDVSIQNETLIYQDKVTGRKITFVATDKPVYVEVEDTGTAGGQWQFQEPWIWRNSETSGQIMPRHNPKYGVACSVPNKVLAAIVSVSADGATPFYKEPLPGNNPAAGLRALIQKYGATGERPVNTNLAEIYPSSITTTILTGAEFQLYVASVQNQRYRDAGWGCDVMSNIKNTWMGGFAEISAVFGERRPREVVNFMLKVPQVDYCYDLAVDCADTPDIPAALDFEPATAEVGKQEVPIPAPVAAVPEAAGKVIVIGQSTTILADCNNLRTVSIPFRRIGGTVGAISITIAGTPSTHANTLPTTVSFADGVTEAVATFTIDAWQATDATSESFVLTFSGASLDAGSYTTRTIRIRANTTCSLDETAGDCASC
jgi:hypothetical protein